MTWEPRRLLEMRYQAETLDNFQTARVKINNRLKRYTDGPEKYLLPDRYMPDGVTLNPDFLNLLAPCILKGPPGKEKLVLPAEQDTYRRLVGIYRLTASADALEWQEKTPGLGADLIARLIGLTGNPRIATPMIMERGKKGEYRYAVPDPDREPYNRTVRQYWSYCGVGDPERRLYSGMPQAELLACGRRRATAVLFNIAGSIVKTKGSKNGVNSPYTWLYDSTKDRYAMKMHETECIPCGTPGHPAQRGTAWKDAHKDNAAREILAKAVLKDLWRNA